MRVTDCRICGAGPLFTIMDYGRMALANSYLPGREAIATEETFPMGLCLCERCGYVQINEIVNPETLFRNYLYVTGVSEAVQAHGKLLVDLVSRRMTAGRGEASFLLEAASNDGTILSAFKRAGWRVLGVDPAENVAAMANARGIETIPDFFGRTAAERVVSRSGKADVFLARHVIAHVANLHDFVEGASLVLKSDGIAVVECSHVLPLYRGLQYDQVYHEHLGYFSVTVLRHLFEMHGLQLFAVDEVGMHGGSIVAFAQREGAGRPLDPSIEKVTAEEAAAGLAGRPAWTNFAARAQRQKTELRQELLTLRATGKRVAAYGAAAKGQVLLQFCGIGADLVDFVVDKSELKQGRLTPGTHIPIYPPEELLRQQPDVVLLCAWNYADEIQRQQKAYLDRGGRLLHPLPLPHYL